MKVLFVCSGNSDDFDIAPFIKSQGDSLQKKGVVIDYFTVKGNGYKGYINSIPKLRKHLKATQYDLIHAHYVLSGWVAVLGNKGLPVICSFMGSDTYGDTNIRGKLKLSSIREIILAKMLQPFLSGIIIKSKNLYNYIWLKQKAKIIPNGVSFSFFNEQNKTLCRNKLGLAQSKQYILFLGNIDNQRKNFLLLKSAYKLLDRGNVELLNPFPVRYSKVPLYLNAADVLVLTSYLEGSPNVIKEAMACSCPIVSTDVGDVKEVLGDTTGCYICSYEPEDVAGKIKKALDFGKRTNGRDNIKQLDSKAIADRIISLYKEVISGKK